MHKYLVPIANPDLLSARALWLHHSQNEVDNNCCQQCQSQDCWSKSVVESTLSSHPDALCSPVEGHECVQHCCERNECEEGGADLTNAVTEVEEADGQTAEDDGEVEP